MSATDDRVELTDLDVIARYSLAVRAATAGRSELIATLRSDLAWLEGSRRAAAPRRESPPPERPAPVRKAAAPARAPARKTAAKKQAAKKTARRSR